MSIIKFLVGAVRAAQFITEHHVTISAGAGTVSFSGAQAGDFALLMGVAVSSATPPAGWSSVLATVISPYNHVVFAKVLNASDISTGSITLAGGNGGLVAVAIYRGPTSATQKSYVSGGTTSLTLTGYTKGANCRVVVTCVLSGSGGSAPVAPTQSGGSHSRLSATASVAIGIADYLPAGNYADSTSLTWTGLADTTSGSFQADAAIIELT